MRLLPGLFATLLFTSLAPAQGAATTLTTALDVGVVANDGTVAVDGIRANTPIASKTTIWAKRHKASAKTTVDLQNDLGREESVMTSHRVTIREDGWAHGKDAKDAFDAHTTDDLRVRGAGPHAFVWVAAARSGAKGRVVITWHGMTSGTARLGASVDLDGDRRPDWTGGVTRRMTRRSFRVVAGARGFVFGIATQGVAGVRGKTRSSYKGFLTVTFTPEGSTQPPRFDCKVESFGRPCGPEMKGEAKVDRDRHYLELVTTKIPLNAIGIHVISPRLLRTPITLPGSKCLLLIEPVHYSFVRQDRGGTALLRIPYRPMDGFVLLNQQVWVDFTPRGLASSATNGVKLSCSKARNP